MNLYRESLDPHRLVGILIAILGVLGGAVLFGMSYEILNRDFGGSYSVYDLKEVAGLCFAFSASLLVLSYFVSLDK